MESVYIISEWAMFNCTEGYPPQRLFRLNASPVLKIESTCSFRNALSVNGSICPFCWRLNTLKMLAMIVAVVVRQYIMLGRPSGRFFIRKKFLVVQNVC
jgi:hypothetical protein